MHIVPVIDLLHGQVVRARRGERQHYRTIESALCGSADPEQVADRLCEHCATDTLYVADLDALQGRPPQIAVIAGLLQRPERRLWLDAGFTGPQAVAALLAALGPAAPRVTPVLASEALPSRDALAGCLALAPAILSLDLRHGRPLDAAGLWDAPALWPERLVVMTLDRVGSAAGPDLARLAALRERAPRARLIGAGGIRDAADLDAAAAAGAEAWLVASALHDLQLPPVAARATDCDASGRGGHSVSRAATVAPGRVPPTANGTCFA